MGKVNEWKEMRATIREIIQGLKEVRANQRKTDEQLKRTDEHLKKTDEQLKKTNEQLKRTDEHLKKMIGELTDGWGKFVEGLVEPSVRNVFRDVGITVRETFQRATSSINGKHLEIDILGVGKDRKGRDIVLVTEVKSSLTRREIDRTIKILEVFTEFFPEYRGKKIVGVIAGVRRVKGVEEYAIRKGLYILTPSGNVMELRNPRNFKPRYWD